MTLQRAAGLVLLAMASCHTPVCGCSPPLSSATVAGRISDTSGAVVRGARVLAYLDVMPSRCVAPAADNGLAVADSFGLYQVVLVAPVAVESACVFLTVHPPSPELRDTTIGPRRLTFRFEPPFDSITVDAVLSP